MPEKEAWSVPGRPGTWQTRLLLLAAAAALISPLIWLNLINGSSAFANDLWITFLVCLIPPAASLACFARSRVSSIDRLAWQLIAIGIACWAVGAIIRFGFMDESQGRPVPAWADPFFMATYPLLFAGLALVIRNRLRSYRHLAIYDAITGFVLLIALVFAFLPGEIKAMTGYDDLATVVLVFYPLGDFALLILLACLFRFTGRTSDGPWPLFGAGLTLFAVADLIFALAVPTFGRDLSFLYTLWLFGFLLMIAGSWRADGEVIEVEPGAVQLIPPVAFLTLAVIGLLHGQGNDLWLSAVVGLTIVVFLVLARLSLSAYEFSRKSRAVRVRTIDQLTSLPSRNRLEELLADQSGSPAWKTAPLFVLVIGLERMSQFERAIGPAEADRLISSVATRVRRAGGDAGILGVIERAEFGVICSQESAPEPLALAKSIQRSFDSVVKVGGVELQLEAVLGVASYPEDTNDPNDLIRLALVSREEARRDGEPFRLAPARPELERRNLHLLEELRSALEQDQIEVYYQPKVSTTDGLVRSVEALVRWEHPELGMMNPGEFVPLAEENGLGPMLTDRVFEHAARQKRDWEEHGQNIDIAVNLGKADLIDESLPRRLRETLDRVGTESGGLTLEVSENLVASKIAPLSRNLRKLKVEGYRLSLDDFGAGATSLAHMRELPLDEIKIDRSLIARMHHSREDVIIGESAVLIAKKLGMNVVAEGAEEVSTVNLLRVLDCGEIQSFFFARPMPPEQLDNWLDDFRPSAGSATP